MSQNENYSMKTADNNLGVFYGYSAFVGLVHSVVFEMIKFIQQFFFFFFFWAIFNLMEQSFCYNVTKFYLI